MSLLSSIQLAGNALLAAQVGLEVTANNISNANTPDYIREEVVFTPAPTRRQGDLLLGLGVQVEAIIQKTDRFLDERLRLSLSDLENGTAQEKTYLELESLIGELGDTDLSTSLNNFFGSIQDILNQPTSSSVRNLAVLRGETLTDDIGRIARQVHEQREDVNNQIVSSATDINRLVEEIADLNIQISTLEGGGTSASDAVGLRDQRKRALNGLASIIDIRVVEAETGNVTVYSGGQFLVSDGVFRQVKATYTPNRGLNAAEIRLAETDSPIESTSGRLAGLIASRDDILGGFFDGLDQFARTLAFEFNKLYSSGQGLSGHTELSSEFAVDDSEAALDQAGLTYAPVNGSFTVLVRNKQTGITRSSDVLVQLNGLDDDTTLESLAARLDAIDGLSATISPSRQLELSANGANVEFAFSNDTSGVLAALGLGTFFTGSSALGLGISEDVQADPGKFAASSGGIGEDSRNAEALASFLDHPLETANGDTLADVYDRLTSGVTQSSSVARALSDGYRVFHESLQGQQLAISGVSLDEEAIRMIQYQRLFQASARFISTVNELLDVLVNL